MACGTIPLTSDRPAIAKFIRDANAGIVFETKHNATSLYDEILGEYPISTATLNSLVQDLSSMTEDVAEMYRRNANDLVLRNFSVESGTIALLSLIAEAQT